MFLRLTDEDVVEIFIPLPSAEGGHIVVWPIHLRHIPSHYSYWTDGPFQRTCLPYRILYTKYVIQSWNETPMISRPIKTTSAGFFAPCILCHIRCWFYTVHFSTETGKNFKWIMLKKTCSNTTLIRNSLYPDCRLIITVQKLLLYVYIMLKLKQTDGNMCAYCEHWRHVRELKKLMSKKRDK